MFTNAITWATTRAETMRGSQDSGSPACPVRPPGICCAIPPIDVIPANMAPPTRLSAAPKGAKDARVDDSVRDDCKLRSPAPSLDRSNVALHTKTHVDDALSCQCCAGLKFLYGVYMPRWQVQHFASRRVICFCATSIM